MSKRFMINSIICLIIFLLFSIVVAISYAGPPAVQIGEVECIKRLVQGNDKIKIIRVKDPENLFISIIFTTVKTGKVLAWADPSNTSITARLTGKIPIDENGKRIINTTPNKDIAHIRKSIGSKIMKIARFYDKEIDTLVYLVYTTKILDGSLKHSISAVPLGRPLLP